MVLFMTQTVCRAIAAVSVAYFLAAGIVVTFGGSQTDAAIAASTTAVTALVVLSVKAWFAIT